MLTAHLARLALGAEMEDLLPFLSLPPMPEQRGQWSGPRAIFLVVPMLHFLGLLALPRLKAS